MEHVKAEVAPTMQQVGPGHLVAHRSMEHMVNGHEQRCLQGCADGHTTADAPFPPAEADLGLSVDLRLSAGPQTWDCQRGGRPGT
eukprot:199382-Chlamydomonas_euryale.AAC.1